MTRLIWWIRSWFCKHNSSCEERQFNITLFGNAKSSHIGVSLTCTKCSWHHFYWKFTKPSFYLGG